jgi:hypothetical protein
VRWSELEFDIVGLNTFFDAGWKSEDDYVKYRIIPYSKYGKPLLVTETGSATYLGCGRWGANAWARYQGEERSEEEQAKLIKKNVELCIRGGAKGIFLYTFLENRLDDEVSFQIIRYSQRKPWLRKLGFSEYANLK